MGEETNQITEPIAKLFEAKNFAFVTTLMKDGWPQITPTWVDLEDQLLTKIILITWLQLEAELSNKLKKVLMNT